MNQRKYESLRKRLKRHLKKKTSKVKVKAPQDPVVFAKEILKFTPTHYQTDFLQDNNKRILLCWSRQSGKTTTIAAKSIWYALTHPETLTLIVAPWQQSAGQYEWFFIDHIVFENCRYSATVEDTTSQNLYGLRELSETDEELLSDAECLLRARALLAHLKDPADYIILRSSVLDYGNTPILPGDKIYLELPNEGVSGYYRIETVEYFVDAKNQTLEVTLELGKAPPLLADYLYGLRSTTVTVEKLARTKLGKGAIPSLTRSVSYLYHEHSGEVIQPDRVNTKNLSVYRELSDANPQIILTKDDQQNPFIQFGQGSQNPPDIWIKRLENNTLELKTQYLWPKVGNLLEIGSTNLDEYNNPKTVGKIYVSSLLLPTDGFLHIIAFTEQQPKARLTQDSLAFGPGGTTVPDTWLKRLAANQFESSGDIIPDGDNARTLGLGGASPKRWKEIHAVDLHVSNMLFNFHLIPDADNTYDLGEGTTPKRWRDIYLAGAIKALAGGVAVHLLPNAHATYDLGSSTMKWSNLYVNGVGDLGWLNVGGYTVITNARVLQNVTADAAIITSGRFPLARLPVGTAGYVLEAQGALDPMYVNPNGRYTPAGHNHAAGDVTSGVFAEDRIPHVLTSLLTLNGGLTMGANLNMNSQAIQNLASLNQAMPPAADQGSVGTTTTYWNCIAGNSVWYKVLGSFACALGLSDKLVDDPSHPFIKFRDAKKALEFVKHEMTKQWRHVPAVETKEGLKVKCPICGKLSNDFCEEHRQEMEEQYTIKTGDLIFALGNLVLNLAAKMEVLEKKLAEKGEAS